MKRYGERLRERRFSQRNIRPYGKCLFLGDDDLVAKRALDMRESHRAAVEANVEALVRMALDAVAAVTARVTRVDCDVIADLDPRHLGSDFHDGSRDLVTKDHRFLEPDRAESPVLVVMEIGPADSACRQGDLDLSSTRTGRSCERFDPQVKWSMYNDCAHRTSSVG